MLTGGSTEAQVGAMFTTEPVKPMNLLRIARNARLLRCDHGPGLTARDAIPKDRQTGSVSQPADTVVDDDIEDAPAPRLRVADAAFTLIGGGCIIRTRRAQVEKGIGLRGHDLCIVGLWCLRVE